MGVLILVWRGCDLSFLVIFPDVLLVGIMCISYVVNPGIFSLFILVPVLYGYYILTGCVLILLNMDVVMDDL